jgi:hypothetical protein
MGTRVFDDVVADLGGYKDDVLMLEVLLKRSMGMDVAEGSKQVSRSIL